jgi:uncharacterized membrane protein
VPPLDDRVPWGVVAMFAIAGTLHFVAPRAYERIMPRWLPAHRALIYASGAAELAGAAGLLVPALRATAGWGLIALLVAVLPANVQMLQDARASARTPRWAVALLWVRLPLQALLMWWVWAAAVRDG